MPSPLVSKVPISRCSATPKYRPVAASGISRTSTPSRSSTRRCSKARSSGRRCGSSGRRARPATRWCPTRSTKLEGARSGLAEPVDAVGVDRADRAPLVLEKAQVRERFADGEAQLMAVELAPEEHRHQLRRGPRFDERIERLVEPCGVMVA